MLLARYQTLYYIIKLGAIGFDYRIVSKGHFKKINKQHFGSFSYNILKLIKNIIFT